MTKFYEYRSNDQELRKSVGTRSLMVVCDDEDTVIFRTRKGDACFTKEEAIEVMQELIKVLSE